MSYELKTDSRGQFMFNLKAGNGEVILTSESYVQKASALAGIVAVQRFGPNGANYDSKTSSTGHPYFILKASNGETIGRSEMYASPSARDNGIASVQQNCTSPEIKDLTGK